MTDDDGYARCLDTLMLLVRDGQLNVTWDETTDEPRFSLTARGKARAAAVLLQAAQA